MSNGNAVVALAIDEHEQLLKKLEVAHLMNQVQTLKEGLREMAHENETLRTSVRNLYPFTLSLNSGHKLVVKCATCDRQLQAHNVVCPDCYPRHHCRKCRELFFGPADIHYCPKCGIIDPETGLTRILRTAEDVAEQRRDHAERMRLWRKLKKGARSNENPAVVHLVVNRANVCGPSKKNGDVAV